MKFNEWYKKRGIRFIYQRALRLKQRYGANAAKAMQRINLCVDSLEEYNCNPTFFVPAVVVKRNLGFIKGLQARGCEIGVHGYQHVDLRSYSPAESSAQLMRAVDVFKTVNLEVHGFRCPYLSSSDELLHALPKQVFKYSSNKAIAWSHHTQVNGSAPIMFATIEKFYRPLSSESSVSLPWMQDGLVEVPVSVPDDLQMYDGLNFSPDQVSAAWSILLKQTQQRGELFNLIFHPELAALCDGPFVEVLKEARLEPNRVWVTRLRDISDWWLQKEGFGINIERHESGFVLNFICTERGTILYKDFEVEEQSSGWDETYRRLLSKRLAIRGEVLPLIGLEAGLPDWVSSALNGMGYLTTPLADGLKNSITIDNACVEQFANAVELREYIESQKASLVRFWPWPDGQRSALCLTGDLDALSLADYATRLFPD